ncbi:MAG: methionyl-tRNA formyltransferase [Victivallaceae bacterium]|nr:methionyl-tRNA formyltransferase [Victivallaceae bacterium]
MKRLKVYFLGSGAIAVPSLSVLRNACDFVELSGVGSQPDRPAGRKCAITPTPLAQAAEKMGILSDKPHSVNDPDFIARLAAMDLDFIVLISFGQLLKAPILQLPRFGCINVHASLLPRYRGASPITSALLARDPVTGVTFMQMAKGLDSGPVFRTIERELRGDEYADTLETALGLLAAEHLPEVLSQIASGTLCAVPQDAQRATVCTKVHKADGRIHWEASAAQIEAMTRAYRPWPGAFCTLGTARKQIALTIRRAAVIADRPADAKPGDRLPSANPGEIRIACGDAVLALLEVAPAGKKPMPVKDFLNGWPKEERGMLRVIETEGNECT